MRAILFWRGTCQKHSDTRQDPCCKPFSSRCAGKQHPMQTPCKPQNEPLSSEPYINVHGLESMENVHLLIFASRKKRKRPESLFSSARCFHLHSKSPLPLERPQPPFRRPSSSQPPSSRHASTGVDSSPSAPPPQHPRGTTVLTVHHGHRPPPSLDNRGILKSLGPTWFRRG